MSVTTPVKRALISVTDKTDILGLAQTLRKFGVEILSTGGTASYLRQHRIPVTDIAAYTGFPEIMAGRLKTLHPKIHGGILARRGIDDEVLAEHQIATIDMVIINLYPFAKTIANPACSLADAVENIDIGGPTMLRAAAKNYSAVTVVVDVYDYPHVIQELHNNHGATTLETRFALAQKVFAHTAGYDAAIANYLGTTDLQGNKTVWPDTYTVQYFKKQDLRYGENPHQKAAFYIEAQPIAASVAALVQHQGKALSFNNIADCDAALQCVMSLGHAGLKSDSACVIVKHANPCGVGMDAKQWNAYQKAFATDPTSAFGGIIAFNQPLLPETATAILDQQFVEAVIAPSIDERALALFAKKPAVRVLSCGAESPIPQTSGFDYKRVGGGLLVQDIDAANLNHAGLRVVTQRPPDALEMADLLFAWQVAKYVKSNAIVLARNGATVGIGAGQMSRVDSVEIALRKAERSGLEVAGTVMASDAFFPFRDGVDTAATAGIRAIIQPGGSIRDTEIIQAANEAGIAMVFTDIRHFRH